MQSVIICANFSLIIFFHKKMLLIKFLVEFTFISKEFCTQTNISCVFNLAHTLKRTSFTLKFLERKKTLVMKQWRFYSCTLEIWRYLDLNNIVSFTRACIADFFSAHRTCIIMFDSHKLPCLIWRPNYPSFSCMFVMYWVCWLVCY